MKKQDIIKESLNLAAYAILKAKRQSKRMLNLAWKIADGSATQGELLDNWNKIIL